LRANLGFICGIVVAMPPGILWPLLTFGITSALTSCASPGEGDGGAQARTHRRADPIAGAVQPRVPRAAHQGAAHGIPGGRRHLLRRQSQRRRQGLAADGDLPPQALRPGSSTRTSIVGRLHPTLLDEHFRVGGRRTWFATIDEMQASLNEYLKAYNDKRPHQGPRHERPHSTAGLQSRHERAQSEQGGPERVEPDRHRNRGPLSLPTTEALSAAFHICTAIGGRTRCLRREEMMQTARGNQPLAQRPTQ
jgi:Integrase core domain